MSIFRSILATPTNEQYALLGRAVSDWSIVDMHISTILARLSRCPDFTGLALVERLGFQPRLDAWRNLLEMHEVRFGYRFIPMETVASGRALIKELKDKKEHRDRVAHAVWMRHGDGMFSFKPQGRQHSPSRPDKDRIQTNAELRELAEEIIPLIESLEAFVSLLPEVPEVP